MNWLKEAESKYYADKPPVVPPGNTGNTQVSLGTPSKLHFRQPQVNYGLINKDNVYGGKNYNPLGIKAPKFQTPE